MDFRKENMEAAKGVFDTYLRILQHDGYEGRVLIRYGQGCTVKANVNSLESMDDYLIIGNKEVMVPWVAMVAIKKVGGSMDLLGDLVNE